MNANFYRTQQYSWKRPLETAPQPLPPQKIRQPLSSIPNNVQTVKAPASTNRSSKTAEFRNVVVPPPDRYLSFYEFEGMHCTKYPRNYFDDKSFSNARST
jgi:hypothetical protein